jgi:nucleoside-diphosphate-sugar epimerase
MARSSNGGVGQRVLVTGAAGYIGAVLCEHLLDAGYEVLALDSLVFGGASLFHLCAHPRFEFQLGDARDQRVLRDVVPRADVLIPLAAVVGAPACDRDPILTRTVNLDAVRQLLALRSPQQLVVYPTTNSGYGTSSGAVQCT